LPDNRTGFPFAKGTDEQDRMNGWLQFAVALGIQAVSQAVLPTAPLPIQEDVPKLPGTVPRVPPVVPLIPANEFDTLTGRVILYNWFEMAQTSRGQFNL
jgi:hypothetical protein